MRAFVAVDLPAEIKEYLGSLQREIRGEHSKTSWVKEESLHITLKFLGDISEEVCGLVKERLSKISLSGFSAKLTSLKALPNQSYVRVITVGVDGDFNRLQKEIDASLSDLFKLDKRFSAHITLGRVKAVNDRLALERIFETKVAQKGFFVSECSLFKSELSRFGARHTVLKTYKLE